MVAVVPPQQPWRHQRSLHTSDEQDTDEEEGLLLSVSVLSPLRVDLSYRDKTRKEPVITVNYVLREYIRICVSYSVLHLLA